MEIYQAIKTRRSVRSYKPDPVPEEILKRLFEAVRLAPSAHNAQAYKFVLVKNPEKKQQLAQAASQEFIARSPIVIAAVSLDPEHMMSNEVPAYSVDAAIAIDHLTLVAASEGLGTCWIGAFDQKKAKKILQVPDEDKVVALLPLGFPADEPRPKARKKLEDIVCSEKFSD